MVRYKTIRLLWQDGNMKEHVALLDGFQAQLVQHLIDHCDGIVV
ncbi:MAG: peptide deformylase [Clostridia bacterium]